MTDAKHILLIEDNPLDVRLLQEVCNEDPSWHIHFDLAASLTEADGKMATNQYCTILLDLGLPESDGLETLETMLQTLSSGNHSSAIIVLTSVNSDTMGDEAIAMGAQDFLVKGEIDAKQLRRAIRYACERQRLAREQKESHARIALMAAALDQASDSIIITTDKGKMCYVNQAFTKITGYDYEEAIDHSPAMLSSGKQSPAFYQRMWSQITTGKQWSSEMIDRRKNGEFYPCHLEIAPVSNDDGAITHFVGIQRDLSEHKLLENQLRQSQKMEAIGTLTGGIAHDFNNMLAGITGNLFLAKRKIHDPAQLQQRLDAVETLCTRAADMIKKMMAFGRNDMVQMAPLDLNPLIKEIYKMMTRLLPETIKLRLDLCDQPLAIVGDATQLHQILLNLLNNARDGVAEAAQPAEIVCSLQPYHPDAQFLTLHPDAQGKTFAHLSVRDNGCGVDEATLQHLTEPFFTTKEVGSGTGLGLSMVDGAVDQHHGILALSSSDGEGMTVDIYLPLIDKRPVDEITIDSSDIISSNGETILIADDEEAVRDMLNETLTLMGYRVIVASNGREAVDLFAQHSQEIRLVLLDVVMPEMSGPESYRQMQKQFNDLPVIFISGYERTKIPTELLAGNRQTCLHKPFHPPRLNAIIQEMLS